MSKTLYIEPLSMPLYLMAKPAGAACNLNCAYCYYLEKDKHILSGIISSASRRRMCFSRGMAGKRCCATFRFTGKP